MKKILILGLLLVFAASTFAQKEEERSLKNFDAISTSGSVKVYLEKGNPGVHVEAMNCKLSEVITTVENGKLVVKLKQKGWINNGKAIVTVSYRELDEISASAGSSITADHSINGSAMDLDVSSGASANLEFEVNELDIDVSSGGSAHVEGYARDSHVDVSSGGSVNCKNMKAKHVDADASSGGSATVWATESIKANASSGGSLKYKGDPEKTHVDSGHSGSIRKM